MKLVEILQATFDRWPEGARIICQDGDGYIKGCKGNLVFSMRDHTWVNLCDQPPDMVELYNTTGSTESFWINLFPDLSEDDAEHACYLSLIADDFMTAQVTEEQWQRLRDDQ